MNGSSDDRLAIGAILLGACVCFGLSATWLTSERDVGHRPTAPAPDVSAIRLAVIPDIMEEVPGAVRFAPIRDPVAPPNGDAAVGDVTGTLFGSAAGTEGPEGSVAWFGQGARWPRLGLARHTSDRAWPSGPPR